MLGKMIENTKDLNMVADRLRARGEISRLQELCKEWLIPEKDMQDFLQGKRLRLAEVPLEEKIFSTASEKIAEEMYQFEGPGLAVALGQYLMERCEEKTLGEQILLPHKSLEKAINFILQRVYERIKKTTCNRIEMGKMVQESQSVPKKCTIGWKNTMR
mgnify:CR=1 FL=1